LNITEQKLFIAAQSNDLEAAKDIVENDYISTKSKNLAAEMAVIFNCYDVMKFLFEYYNLKVDEKQLTYKISQKTKDFLINRIRLEKLKLLDKTV
jgi:hypothetical protein